MGSSSISISKKHLKLIKKPQILCKKPRSSTKGYGEAAACGRGMIQRHNPTHIPTKDINTCCPYWKRTQEGRSGSGTRKLCSWVRQLLFPLCFIQMPSYATAKCLPQNHPTTLCHMPPVCSNLPPVSTTYNTVFYGWSASLQRCDTWCYLLEEKSLSIFYSEYFLHWFFQIIHSVN